MSTMTAAIDALQNELVSSVAQLRELGQRARAAKQAYGKAEPISGRLNGPVAFPSNPTAGQPFAVADALQVHIPKDSKPGTYDILFAIALLSPSGKVVARSMLNWPVEPQFGPDFGWAPTALEVPGQIAGEYTIVSLLTLLPPGDQPMKLDAKPAALTIAQ
jgi:hypothetical protein